MSWTLGRIANHKFFQAISLCAELYVGPNIKPGRAPNWWVTEDRRRRIINLGVHYRVSECILLHLAIWWCQPSITKQVELRKNHDLEEDPVNSLFTIFLSCYRDKNRNHFQWATTLLRLQMQRFRTTNKGIISKLPTSDQDFNLLHIIIL